MSTKKMIIDLFESAGICSRKKVFPGNVKTKIVRHHVTIPMDSFGFMSVVAGVSRLITESSIALTKECTSFGFTESPQEIVLFIEDEFVVA